MMPTTVSPVTTRSLLNTPDALLCWNCFSVLTSLTDTAHRLCPACHAVTRYEDGIWRCLSPRQVQHHERFVAEYEAIRAAEGRGSRDAAYYLALPYQDLSGALSAQWSIRARTFDHLTRTVIEPRAARHARPLRILDLGAGNGWLSYRLALLGHHPVAVDLLANQTDGLGAAAHFPLTFPRVQASLDQLPFEDETFDLAIFNASFHYAVDFTRTAAEALRCLRPGGALVLADTPWYRREASGRRMVEEKHAHFRTSYGFASNSIASQEFLTPVRLEAIASALHLTWQVFKPFYGIRWTLRPVIAWLKHRRSPARFRIFVAGKPS